MARGASWYRYHPLTEEWCFPGAWAKELRVMAAEVAWAEELKVVWELGAGVALASGVEKSQERRRLCEKQQGNHRKTGSP